ncbi:Na+/H+ antiporter NhaC [Staphylococcus pasteuri]|uniref:Na+/H+ antiporter NhaC n=1 Tax=Staphylococcus pasteuri TaxID=45972 RepID=UPI0012B8520C|nr:Na+/H+ antiporter NhaC [Staphylococcus pasteuri]
MKLKTHKKNKVSFIESLIILILLLAILGYLIIFQKLSPHVPILLVFMLLLFYGKIKGFTWDEIQDGIQDGIKSGIIPIIIFILIGVLVSTWIMSGTIPTIMVYGFKIISVKFFLPTVFIVCSLIGITVGSSFTTISTMGIAFLGIGHILGFNSAMTAGAIVSGAFLGNNISPLSDTTNLAAGIGEIDLFTHILNVMWTVIPAFIISIFGYILLGTPHLSSNLNSLNEMINHLNNGFNISFISLLPLAFLFVFAWKKIPAIPTLLVGSTVAIILSIINNPNLSIQKISTTVMNGYVANTGDKSLDNLLSRGGIMSMLGSACLIILALALGGLLIKFEIISTLIDKIKDFVNSAFKLIGLTALSSIMINILVGEQYLSIILPGKTFKNSFDSLGLPKKYLTRTLADAGTAVNAIIPWGVSGTFIMGALKVNTLEYLPYAFFPLLCPIITILLGLTLKNKVNKI